MKKKLLVLAWPIGFILFLIYIIGDQYFIKYPDIIAYPMMSISVILLLIGCFYNRYCTSKGLDPYKF